ncbi:MAG: SCO family protein [Reichenbachiella sp.]|uniref:SCO family protein n=1 Tax=Reichenbachiella sp. TaxID=2184521 RepID=UPI003265234C
MNWIISKWYTRTSVFGWLAVMGFTFGCSPVKEKTSRVPDLPFYDEATYTPQWINPTEVADDFHQIPSFSLTNQQGQQITEKHLDDKITVVDFFFTTCPGICPKMTNNMLLVQEAFAEEETLQILSHSVTPDYDDVDVLKIYAEAKGVKNERWHLLTGEQSTIYDLGRNHYFIEEDLGLEKDPEDFIHTENFVLIDQNRRIRGIYNGLSKTAISQLIADAKTLMDKG